MKILTILLAAALCLAPQALMAEWEIFENCRLVPNEYNDGDSFHVRHNGGENIFRLYFVDAPETDDSLPERVAEQAAHFGITSEQAIEIGLDAQYAMQQLLERPFDVATRWQDAGGRSRLPRHYAFVFIEGVDGQKAADYAAVLVAHGLARVHGVKAKPANTDLTAGELETIYRKIEQEACSEKKGGWNRASLEKRTSSPQSTPESSNTRPPPAATPDKKKPEPEVPADGATKIAERSVRQMGEIFERRFPEKYGQKPKAKSSTPPPETLQSAEEPGGSRKSPPIAPVYTKEQRASLRDLQQRAELRRGMVRLIRQDIQSDESRLRDLRKEQVNAEGIDLTRVLLRIKIVNEEITEKRKRLEVAEADLQEASDNVSNFLDYPNHQ